jgi:hypothetical protein
MNKWPTVMLVFFYLLAGKVSGQLVINEGSNKNYSALADEHGEYEDWIEIYNAGNTTVDLVNYSLSDNATPGQWVFPHQLIQPGGFVLVFCSGENRYSSEPFVTVVNDTTFQPQSGWNTHDFSNSFIWDGFSNLVVNLCNYNAYYTNNSVHSQTQTTYNSSLSGFTDGGSACGFTSGGNAQLRPNIRLNSSIIGAGFAQNGPYDYPSPYGNWYWSSRQQYLFRAEELSAAGLLPGPLDSLAFDVIAPCPTGFSLMEISMANTGVDVLSADFIPSAGNKNHTNFKIDSEGETISLYSPSSVLVSSLHVNCGPGYDVSVGAFPDGSSGVKKFSTPTPGMSNNTAVSADNYALAPNFSLNSGIYTSPISVSISDPNLPNAIVHYTVDGSDPDTTSPVWNGTPVFIFQTTVLRARAFVNGLIPSTTTSAGYLFNVNHITPIISVMTDPENLFGPQGMFDNPGLDLLKAASIDYFDSTSSHNLLFSRRAGIVMDGGWGSRGLPQRPFRIKFGDGVLGQGPVSGNIIPGRPLRNQYSDFMLRNGSNNFLILPHKDAAQVKMMGDGSNAYYAAWRPVSVYINGTYWGLYELREKFNTEMFALAENATESTVEILGSSAQYGFQLRAIEGDVQNFYDAYAQFSQLNPSDTSFWSLADQYFDMEYYTDYVIGEVFMNNADWAFNYNNLKIYRSDATGFRWRYCLMDMEYGLLPNPSNDFTCSYDLLGQLMNWGNVDPNNPHITIFLKGIQNNRFRNYFINRFADQLNSRYLPSRLTAIENTMFNQTVAESANQFQRWGDPNNVPAQVTHFYQTHLTFLDELVCRPEQARNYIQAHFNLPQQVDLQLDVLPAGAGKIRISTLTPDTYPWNGIYFDGVPVRIEAIAEPGYQFSHWGQNGLMSDTLNPVFLDTLTANDIEFTACFYSTLSIPETDGMAISVYPNPSSDRVTISLTYGNVAPLNIHVVDVLGKVHALPFSAVGPNEISADVSGLSSGYYVILYTAVDGKIVRGGFIKR